MPTSTRTIPCRPHTALGCSSNSHWNMRHLRHFTAVNTSVTYEATREHATFYLGRRWRGGIDLVPTSTVNCRVLGSQR